ncbi:oxygen-dependent coproporphyrinogen oxidase [Taibaiella sp. KBW10]|nr:oxygen-dependent coproporphyrinogen oxidase [Taibaiella sp. KBW10]
MFNKNTWIDFIHDLQNRICTALEACDGSATFVEDLWERPEGGGGKTRVISNGAVFEKGGVNTSIVHGMVSDVMRKQLQIEGHSWFACGLSLVIHPKNPFVPTTHANWRYFELYDAAGNICDCWFGGGADLTPYYLDREDAMHFHGTLKKALDPFDKALYPVLKKQCDHYFNNTHRGFEMRGIGGVFYDHVKPDVAFQQALPDTKLSLDSLFAFQQANGNCFTDAYIPIVEKHKHKPYTAENKYWQEIRRGRYVEFNLIHDRGTIFGLKTNGRTESILMSLPPTVRFDYNYQPAENSPEALLLDACQYPKDWA